MVLTPGETESYAQKERIIRSSARTAKADFSLRYLDIEKATGIEGARWQPFQIEYLNNDDLFVSVNKSRQIGMSFTASCDELADGLIKGNHTVVAVSFNLEEAKEKIVYAKRWWESREEEPHLVPGYGEFDGYGNWRGPSPYRVQAYPELTTDNSLALEWSNGFRFISHPCRPPRGKKASVLLDEFAHYQHDKAIIAAAFPMITRGMTTRSNHIRSISTPLGALGQFYEIHEHVNKHPDYVRYNFGWWEIEDLCHPSRRLECYQAWLDGTPVEEMVRIFGTKEAKIIFRNKDKEDFLQEYHLSFLDSAHSFFPYALIRSCYPVHWTDFEEDLDEVPITSEEEYQLQYIHFKAIADSTLSNSSKDELIDTCLDAIRQLADAVRKGLISRCLCWSYDCGRDHDCAEICVFERVGNIRYQRLMLTMRQIPFEQMRAVITALMESLPIIRGMMDKGGLGREISEWATNRWGEERATPVDFTAPRKEMWVLDLKKAMENHLVTLIPDRDQEQQIHAIQRRVTSAKNMVYEITEKKSTVAGGKKVTHHGDKFWVVAMCNATCATLDHMFVSPRSVPPGTMTAEGAVAHVSRRTTYTRHRDTARGASQAVIDKMRRA